METNFTAVQIIPEPEDFVKLLSAKISYEHSVATKNETERKAWEAKHFTLTPWGIGTLLSKRNYVRSSTSAAAKGKAAPEEPTAKLFRYFIAAVAIDWQELIIQLKRTISIWGYDTAFLQKVAELWKLPSCQTALVKNLSLAQGGSAIKLTEAIEKHETLNPKLFNKEEVLRDQVRNKMLEIVDHFIDNLKEQKIKIKVKDILFVGSNASYNYTKNSDIDLHIIADTKSLDYPENLGNALYSAYRTLFNKSLDISIYDFPLELYVETETSPRKSNGEYSVKNDKWVKKPIPENIPDFDKKALATIVDKWEMKCKELIKDIKADKLDNEEKVLKLIEDIYEKLRKKGMAEGEYSLLNLAFKEIRNKGYLDELKKYRDELISKRLSLEERLEAKSKYDIYNEIAQIAGTQPVIQDDKCFYIYNLKANTINNVLGKLKQLPYTTEVSATENGKYDFTNINQLAMRQVPTRYFDIKGKLSI